MWTHYNVLSTVDQKMTPEQCGRQGDARGAGRRPKHQPPKGSQRMSSHPTDYFSTVFVTMPMPLFLAYVHIPQNKRRSPNISAWSVQWKNDPEKIEPLGTEIRDKIVFTKDDFKKFASITQMCIGINVSETQKDKLFDLNTDFFVFYYADHATSPAKTPVAFLAGRVIDDAGANAFYIDLICSIQQVPNTHNGKLLMGAAEALARVRGCTLLKLSALPTVLDYYPKLGYAHVPACNRQSEKVTEPRPLHELTKSYYAHDSWVHYFINYLHKEYNTARKSADFAACDNDNITFEEFKKNECANEGFIMRKCLDPVPLPSAVDPTAQPVWLQKFVALQQSPAPAPAPTPAVPPSTSARASKRPRSSPLDPTKLANMASKGQRSDRTSRKIPKLPFPTLATAP